MTQILSNPIPKYSFGVFSPTLTSLFNVFPVVSAYPRIDRQAYHLLRPTAAPHTQIMLKRGER